MRKHLLLLITTALLMIPASAMAQQVTTYYYSTAAPVVYAPTTTTVPVARYYSPTPVSYYSPVVGGSAPIIYARPTYQFYSPYGGTEVRVPGQPILNTLRSVIP